MLLRLGITSIKKVPSKGHFCKYGILGNFTSFYLPDFARCDVYPLGLVDPPVELLVQGIGPLHQSVFSNSFFLFFVVFSVYIFLHDHILQFKTKK